MAERQEISLIDVMIWCGRGVRKSFCRLWWLLRNSIRLSIAYFWISVPITLIFLISGWYFTDQPYTTYKADGIIVFAGENRIFIAEELAALNSLKGNSPEEFATKLSLTDEEMKGFREFRSYPVIDFLGDSTVDMSVLKNSSQYMTDTVNRIVKNMISLRIYMKGTTDYKPYIEGLIGYLNSQPNMQRIDSVSRCREMSRIEFCTTELDRLARFSEYDYFDGGEQRAKLRTAWNGNIRLEPSRDNLYYVDMRNLIKEKNFLEKQMAFRSRGVVNTISEYMNVSDFPRKYKLAIIAILGVIASLIVALKVNNRLQKVTL